MSELYKTAGFSRQAHWEYMRRREKLAQKKEALLLSVHNLRDFHPAIGGRKLYHLIRPDFLGRDLFFDFLRENHLLNEPQRRSTKTTYSTRSHWFPDLVAGLQLNGINQLWVSDITDFKVGDQFFYLIFIMDVYSRRILGYVASEHMRAQANLLALNRAITLRDIKNYLRHLIHHSDQGVQYASYVYTDRLAEMGILTSMSSNVLQNAHIERVNGTIKNDYLRHWKITSLASLRKNLKAAVEAYNHCPHWSLEFLSPVDWETKMMALPKSERPVLKLYDPEREPSQPQPRNQLKLF